LGVHFDLGLDDRGEKGMEEGARTFTRRRAIAGSAAIAGAAAVSVATGVELLSGQGASSLSDAEPLALALALERLQSAFYTEALAGGTLSGELLSFATTAAEHEAEHEELLVPLVPDPPDETAYDFGADTTDPAAFAAAAASLEDLAVSAYNGLLAGLTERGLAIASRIVSVDARHAAWIRAINGDDPAADAVDESLDADQVVQRLEATGYLKEATP
jgi:Ferritin-like domain